MQRESNRQSIRENECHQIVSHSPNIYPCTLWQLSLLLFFSGLTSVAARYKCAQAALQCELILYAMPGLQVLDAHLDVRANKTAPSARETGGYTTSGWE